MTMTLPTRRPDVLIVDHDPDHLRVCAALLQPFYQIATVTTPFAAIDRLGSERFDIVLSEQSLSPMYGTELMAVVRRLHEGTWRVLMSAAHETPEIRSAIDLGNVHRFLTKPVAPEQLVAAGVRHGSLPRCAILDHEPTRALEISASLADSGTIEPVIAIPGDRQGGVDADVILLVDPESPQDAGEIISALRVRNPMGWILVALRSSSVSDAAAYRLAGADDFVSLPVRPDEVCLRYQARAGSSTDHVRPSATETSFSLPNIVAGTSAMQSVLEQVHRVASSDASVLLAGETGTGKEIIARALHALSSRRDAPFLALNLSALPESLVESELFGHEKGAFTGAQASRQGRLDAVDRGVLFLDEVGDLSLGVQVKLLRVLEQRTFERLGSTASRRTDFRLICATHRDIDTMVANGSFREDLYYRINVVRISLPPLRERREDIPHLVEFFLERFSDKYGGRRTISAGAMNALLRHDWPGNVRELEHMIERATAMSASGSVIDESLFRTRKRRVSFNREIHRHLGEGRGLREILADIEQRIIADALERCGGNQLAASKKLAIPRQTLQNRLKKYGL